MNWNSTRSFVPPSGGFRQHQPRLLFPLLLFILIAGCSGSGQDTSADDALGSLQLVSFYLPAGQDQLHEFHRFKYVIGVRPSAALAARTAVTANVFLVDSRHSSERQLADSDPQCHVGSTSIVLGEPGENVVVSDWGMPLSGCAPASGLSEEMSFVVHLEPDDRLLANESLDHANHYILTNAMSTKERNRGCVGADGQPGCVVTLRVAPSPGVDLDVTGLTLDSNIVLNYSRSQYDFDHDELHTPNVTVSVALWADGVSPNQGNALAGDQAAVIRFGIRPAKGGSWLPLMVMDPGSRTPFDHFPSFTIDAITSGGQNSFSHRLFLPQAAYDATGPGGAWAGEFNFELRACAHPSFDEANIPVRDEAANNCRVAPFFLTERLAYNPDAHAEQRTDVVPVQANAAPVQALQARALAYAVPGEFDGATEAGLKKPYEVAMGSANPVLVWLSLKNEAVYGVEGKYSESGGSGHLVPGTGVPFAAIRTGLSANQSGWLDVELLHIRFSHKITHKDSVSGADWDFKRKYHPGLQLRIFGKRFVDLEGAIALPDGATTIIDKDRLEKMSSLFIKTNPEEAKKKEQLSFAQQLCQKNGINAHVLTITANVCVVGTVGLDWNISVTSLSPPFSGQFADAKSVAGLDVSVGPKTMLTLVASAKVDLPVLKGELTAEVDLIKLQLSHQLPSGDYREGGGFYLATGALSESAILGSIGTQAVLEERMLDGKMWLRAEIPSGIGWHGWKPYVKYQKKTFELFSWEGISIARQTLWNLEVSQSIDAAVVTMP